MNPLTITDLDRIISTLSQFLILNLPSILLFALFAAFVIISVVLVYHWKRYSHDFLAFYGAGILYFAGSAALLYALIRSLALANF